MPPKQNGETEHDLQDAVFAKNHLAALEAKIDELLAATGQQHQSESSSTQSNGTTHNTNTQTDS
ncbi:unnamed protein product [Aureobasidium vineae]|uniref:Uncharacterized protein n=1 Tax=Aureobasidium vineae TaxID=2773715 RepID=A0A9N8JDR7_9PEZI|nr:unnamed protein product [Aureobasidium vineae]